MTLIRRLRKAKRLTMSQKKALRPERYCLNPRCYIPAKHIERCTRHAKIFLDALMRSVVVTSDVCDASEWHSELFPCGGPIQVNHGIKREYLITRWLPENVIAGCRDLNLWAKHHDEEWRQMLMDWWGPEKFERLRRLSISKAVPDYESARAALITRIRA